jgi:hypothetical protein
VSRLEAASVALLWRLRRPHKSSLIYQLVGKILRAPFAVEVVEKSVLRL